MIKEEKKTFWKKNKFSLIRLVSQSFFFILLNIGLFASIIFGVYLVPLFSGVILPIEQGFASPFSSISGAYNVLEYYITFPLIPYITIGIFLLFGILFGRATCSWVCPFGFIQEIIEKFPQNKVKPDQNTEKLLSNIPYLIILISLGLCFIVGAYRIESPLSSLLGPFSTGPFTKIDPYVTLNSVIPWQLIGIPFPILGGDIWAFFGQNLFFWFQVLFLLIVLMMAVWIPKVYCRYICPTGAILGYLNEFSWFGLRRDLVRCLKDGCRVCENVCPMNIPILKLPYNRIRHRKCDYCLKCVEKCPENALKLALF